jgi:hypothetical protein
VIERQHEVDHFSRIDLTGEDACRIGERSCRANESVVASRNPIDLLSLGASR